MTYVLVRSDADDGGWSLHAPGATDEQIARGEAPPLVSGLAKMVNGEWDRPHPLDYAVAAVKAAKNLRNLHDALRSFEEMLPDDSEDEQTWRDLRSTALPTFGGGVPRGTFDVRSWDAHCVLVGGDGPFAEWEIVPREEWFRHCRGLNIGFRLVRNRGDGEWSLHSLGATDQEIASGAAAPILSGVATQDLDGEWSRPNRRDYAAAAIKSAPDLYELLEALQEFGRLFSRYADIEHELARYDINIGELPTFGGEEPRDTIDTWSWDDANLLVGGGPLAAWRIEPREEQDDDFLDDDCLE
jgi:hypothetical protein